MMSTAVEGSPQERDNRSRLIIIGKDGRPKEAAFGSLVKPPCFKGFNWLRLPRTQGDERLYVTCMNMSETNGDLLVFEAEVLNSRSTPLA